MCYVCVWVFDGKMFTINSIAIVVVGVRNTMEVEDWGVKTPYQAILSKPLKR